MIFLAFIPTEFSPSIHAYVAISWLLDFTLWVCVIYNLSWGFSKTNILKWNVWEAGMECMELAHRVIVFKIVFPFWKLIPKAL